MGTNRLLDYFNTPRSSMSAKELASRSCHVAQERWDVWQREIQQYVRQHPGLAMGAAVVLGVALGWLIKRRP